MDFITAEQFLQQPKEVQKVFIDWWHKNIKAYDLYKPKHVWGDIICLRDDKKYIEAVKMCIDDAAIPLLAESQLRHFIEDKTDCIIRSNPYKNHEYKWVYLIDLIPRNEDTRAYSFKEIQLEDYLQTLWQVACKIAL